MDMDSTVQLPFDFYRTPGTKTLLASHAFDLAVSAAGAGLDRLLAAAFGVQLFRYHGQSSIVLNVSKMTAARKVCWSRPFALSISMDTSCRVVLAQTEEFFRRMDSAPADGDASDHGPENSRAAITVIELEQPSDLPASWDASRFIADSALASRNDDLRLVAAYSKENLRVAFVYNSNLFKKNSIERFAGHLKELLTRMGGSPDAPVSTLPLLTPTERSWIESVCDGPRKKSLPEFVHQSFERQAAAAPDAPAVRYRDLSLTYRELNSRANVLARHLVAQGIGTECRVVVCLEPSFDIVVALLAILKAGAIYIPLDPTYPPARIFASLEDIQPKLLLTREYLKKKVGKDGLSVLTFDDFEKRFGKSSDENLDPALAPEQTAYIYYTSGTTGKPKGAMASQANLASYIRVARERYQIGKADVMPAIARFTFSISMFELMSPLAAGGTLVVLDRDHILDLRRMSKTLSEVTFFHAGPSLLKNLIAYIKQDYPDFSPFARVRHASSGGDMIPPEVLENLKQIFFKAEVFVIYGSSEISCMGCTYPVTRDRPIERTYVGRPFDNMIVRVLDSAFNLLPVGVVGEIHFAGDGIVKGYLNRPELTVEKFVEIDGRRFYRTGDMGRLSEDGWLEILGRSDFQVKLNGIRIELGEVEHNLRRAPGVRECAVMTKRITGDEKALVAYVVMDPSAGINRGTESPTAAVRRYMTEHVPDYMVPATYVELEKLPLNHNMKVDRHALPGPEEANERLDRDTVLREPRTSSERKLAALWKRLLRIDRIGLDDYFFDLGGHSILGINLIIEAERELGAKLTGMDVLRETLEGQAAICDQRSGRTAAQSFSSRPMAAAAAAAESDFEAFYFGEGGSLYGVLSGMRQKRTIGKEAVLICPPIGQEHVRAYFVLQRLAKRLAAQGVPALRFDYYGCGDSMGESIDATCGRWQRDIGEAFHELKRRSGASRIIAVGARLGAALLGNAAGDLDLARLVVWDPVCDGAEYFAQTVAMHKRCVLSLKHWRFILVPPPSNGETELIGLRCSAAAVREIKGLNFPLDRAQACLQTKNFDPGWNDITRLDQILPDIGISTLLTTMALKRL